MFARSTPFLRGFDRISAPVSKSPSFRSVVEQKATDELRAIAAETKPSVRSRSYRAYVKANLKRIVLYAVKPAQLVFFGKTKNNLREFAFLREILDEHGIKYSHRVFLQDFPSSNQGITAAPAEVVEEVLKASAAFAMRKELTVGHFQQHLQYAKTYLNIFTSYAGRKQLLPKLAVVANDHSPAQVAFIAVMESFGIPVIYVQHAEVSPAFPALDFAASLLRNEVSLDIYRKIGPMKGRTFIASRNRGSHAFDKVATTCAEAGLTVGIYPTTRFDLETLRRTVGNLERNQAISGYFVKPHPANATKLDDADRVYLRVRDMLPAEPHVALVGNSSVVTDLLARGVPVFQMFELDDIEPDYYGFVRDGLVPRITSDDVRDGCFWRGTFYDAKWLHKAARFEPAMKEDQSKVRKDIAQFVRATLQSGREGPSLSAKRAIKTALTRVVQPVGRRYPRAMAQLANLFAASAGAPLVVSMIHRSEPESKPGAAIDANTAILDAVNLLMDRAGSPLRLADTLLENHHPEEIRSAVISWFDSRWAERDQRAFDLVREQSQRGLGVGDVWLRLKACDLTAAPLDQQTAADVVSQVQAIGSPSLRKMYEQVARRVLIKNGHVSLFLDLVGTSPKSLAQLSSNYKVEIARWLVQHRGEHEHIDQDEFRRSLTEFERVKIYAAGITEFSGDAAYDHSSLEERFAALVHPSLAAEFNGLVRPAYERMRSSMSYMDARTNPDQLRALHDRIDRAVRSGEPFSLMRLGDGEAYLFAQDDFPFTSKDRAMRERHWWNGGLKTAIRNSIIHKSMAAAREVDILGIPSIHRFFRDFSEGNKHLLGSTANRGIVTAVLGAETILSSASLTEDRIHHLLFTPQHLRELMAAARQTVIVCSIRASRIQERLGTGFGNVTAVEIPTHAKTKQNPLYVDWTEPLPFVLPAVEDELRRSVGPGDLVLVSGGVAGKSLIGVAKQKGAVALDVGGQIEALVGIPNGALF